MECLSATSTSLSTDLPTWSLSIFTKCWCTRWHQKTNEDVFYWSASNCKTKVNLVNFLTSQSYLKSHYLFQDYFYYILMLKCPFFYEMAVTVGCVCSVCGLFCFVWLKFNLTWQQLTMCLGFLPPPLFYEIILFYKILWDSYRIVYPWKVLLDPVLLLCGIGLGIWFVISEKVRLTKFQGLDYNYVTIA